MTTYAYAYDAPRDFDDRVAAYAALNGVSVENITDYDIVVTDDRGLYTTIRPTLEIHRVMDHDDLVYVVTLNGRLENPAVPYAEDYFVSCGGSVLHIADPHPLRVRRPDPPSPPRLSVAERLAKGREDAVRRGRHPGGPAPYGYRWNREKRHLLGARLDVREDEAKVVRAIFKQYLKRKSLNAVVRFLEDRKVKTRNGKHWSKAAVLWLLKNEVYVGRVRIGEIRSRGTHDPIVSPIIFNKVQATLRRNKPAR